MCQVTMFISRSWASLDAPDNSCLNFKPFNWLILNTIITEIYCSHKKRVGYYHKCLTVFEWLINFTTEGQPK